MVAADDRRLKRDIEPSTFNEVLLAEIRALRPNATAFSDAAQDDRQRLHGRC